MIEALAADGPATDLTGKMELYGRLIDSWDLDVSRFLNDGSKRRRQRYRSAWKQLRRTFDPVELLQITQNSFRWRGETSRDSGTVEATSWRLDLEFFARRVA
jgi:hypothetical protein